MEDFTKNLKLKRESKTLPQLHANLEGGLIDPIFPLSNPANHNLNNNNPFSVNLR